MTKRPSPRLPISSPDEPIGSKKIVVLTKVNPEDKPDFVLDGMGFDIKVLPTHVGLPPGALEAVGVGQGRRVVRMSKGQWYCAADPKDERVAGFCKELRNIRAARKWSQAQAAEVCDMTQPQWSNLESGSVEPLPKRVFEMERLLKVEPGTLSEHLGYSPKGGDDRELFTQVLEKLDSLYSSGSAANAAVLEEWGLSISTIEQLLNEFTSGSEKIGLDVLNTLLRLSRLVMEELEVSVTKVWPKVYAMKANRTEELAGRISLIMNEQDAKFAASQQVLDDYRENNGGLPPDVSDAPF